MIILTMYEWYQYFEDCYLKYKDNINPFIVDNIIKKYDFVNVYEQCRNNLDKKNYTEKYKEEYNNILLNIRKEILKDLLFEYLKILIEYKNSTELALKYNIDFKPWEIEVKDIKDFKIITHQRSRPGDRIVTYMQSGARVYFINPFLYINNIKNQFMRPYLLQCIYDINSLYYDVYSHNNNNFMNTFIKLLMLSLNSLIKILWLKMNNNEEYFINFTSTLEYARICNNISKYSISTDNIDKFLIEYKYYVNDAEPNFTYQTYINYSNGRLIINDIS